MICIAQASFLHYPIIENNCSSQVNKRYNTSGSPRTGNQVKNQIRLKSSSKKINIFFRVYAISIAHIPLQMFRTLRWNAFYELFLTRESEGLMS